MKNCLGTVLVCGAGGFIGSHIVADMKRESWNMVGAGRSTSNYAARLINEANIAYYSGDLSDADFTQSVLHEVNPDAIIFAAGPADVASSFLDPVKDLKSQIIPLSEVLSGCRQLKRIPKILLLSSAAVYGNPNALPVSEAALTKPISPYGYHKLLQEQVLSEFANLYGFPWSIARIFSTYGEGLRHLAVWDITRRAISGEYTVRGGGEESRDYIYIGDLVKAIEAILLYAPFCGEIINIASGNETKIRDLANIVFSTLGHHQSAYADGTKMDGNPTRWRADIAKLSELGFKPMTELADGIRRTIKWIAEND